MTNCSYFCSYHSWTEHLFLAIECFALIISDFSDKSIVLAQMWVYQNVILVKKKNLTDFLKILVFSYFYDKWSNKFVKQMLFS